MATSQSDPFAPDRSADAVPADRGDEEVGGPANHNLLQMIGDAETISREYQDQVLTAALNRTYRAWRNQYSTDSKYLTPAYRGRSRVFVPKTRSAVRKNQAGAAAALFSTDDAVSVTAEHEDDPIQRAVAAVIGEDLNARMNRSSRKTGVQWFQSAMGAHLDAQRTGVCISKQYWEYKTVEETTIEIRSGFDEMGLPYEEEVEVTTVRVIRDRPVVSLVPIENVGIDPAAPWMDPVGLGGWFYCRYPMRLVEAREMIATQTGQAWLPDIDDGLLLKGRMEDARDTTRRQREGGTDRLQDNKRSGDWDVIWIQENFIRIGEVDWHFWSVGRHGYLSKIRPVREVYPAHDGERPYRMGVAQIDPHMVFPMSPVESWAPLQHEINEITNLRLDTLKRAIAPLVMVKSGRKVDLASLQNRGRPEAILSLQSFEDVKMEQTPSPPAQSFTEASTMAAHFDELSGTYSTSSVQNDRRLNETVGGMQLAANASNAVSEFDLRVWVETWVEPVLRQVVQLIRYYENDETMLAVAGAKARVMAKFQEMPGLSEFDRTELSLRVNVGIGSSDPMQKLGKLRAAVEMLTPFLEQLKMEGITFDGEAIIEEVMGAAGFRDGRRFFKFGEPAQPQPDPELIKHQEEMKRRDAEIEADREKTTIDNRTKLQLQAMKDKAEMTKTVLSLNAERERREKEESQANLDRFASIFAGRRAA